MKERGDIVAKFAYANWGRQDGATRQMAENAVQMVQRIPSPRGDKNGADINLALDALEMAFTHTHVNAFAIVSGDSDFIPLVNKLKEYGKTVFVVGGKAFTSTILQQNCHEFISFESLLSDAPDRPVPVARERVRDPECAQRRPQRRSARRGRIVPIAAAIAMATGARRPAAASRSARSGAGHAAGGARAAGAGTPRRAAAAWAAEIHHAAARFRFNERAYGASSFSDFVEKLKRADLVNVSGTGGRYIIERKGSSQPERADAQARRSAAAAARRARKSSPGDRKRLPGGGSGRLVQSRAAQLRRQRLRIPGSSSSF